MNHRCHTRGHDQATIRGVREGRDSALDLARIAHVDRSQLHPESRRGALDCAQLAAPRGYGGVPKDRRSCHARRNGVGG
jgi:hypothetical protein